MTEKIICYRITFRINSDQSGESNSDSNSDQENRDESTNGVKIKDEPKDGEIDIQAAKSGKTCRICKKTFTRKDGLHRHVMEMHGGMPISI